MEERGRDFASGSGTGTACGKRRTMSALSSRNQSSRKSLDGFAYL